MGLYYNTYIGAYITVKNRVEEFSKQVKACRNEQCSDYGNPSLGSFCSTCGELIKEATLTEVSLVSPYWVIGNYYPEYEDELNEIDTTSETHSLLVSNYRHPEFHEKIHDDGCCILNIPEDQRERDIKAFKERFKDLLEILLKEFGEIRYNWGVIVYRA